MEGHITMSKKELSRLEIISKVIEKRLKQREAAEMLGLGIRQIKRLCKGYNLCGAKGLVSKHRGSISNHRLSSTIKQQVIDLIIEHYRDFGPTLAAEKLREKHAIILSVESIRKIMIEANIWVTRDNRLKRAYQPRYRRPAFGELIQIDGSEHAWFEDRAPKSTLLVYVDDATSKLMAMRFVPHESMFTYFQVTKEYLLRYGKPLAFYSDKLSVFRVNQKSTEVDGENITQFGRALSELNIQIICANSCQAKGRVERAHKTLQDRLVKELRLRGISTIEEGNAYLPEFLADYNKRFGKEPLSKVDAHRPLLPNEDITRILCCQEDRTLSNNLTIQYNKIKYMIEDTLQNRKLKRKRVTIYDYDDGRVEIYAGKRQLNFRLFYDKITTIDPGAIVCNKRLGTMLEYIKNMQEQNPQHRSQSVPSHSHLGLTHGVTAKRRLKKAAAR